MKSFYNVLEWLDKVFDFLGSDTMFYVITIWFVIIFISVFTR